MTSICRENPAVGHALLMPTGHAMDIIGCPAGFKSTISHTMPTQSTSISEAWRFNALFATSFAAKYLTEKSVFSNLQIRGYNDTAFLKHYDPRTTSARNDKFNKRYPSHRIRVYKPRKSKLNGSRPLVISRTDRHEIH